MKDGKNKVIVNADIENRDELIKIAHLLVSNKIGSKELIPQPCEVCGRAKTIAHHDDYREPLNVRWLCYQHHFDFHNNRTMSTSEPIVKKQMIIVLISPSSPPETWSNLKKLCEAKGWKYNTLSRKKFPIEWKGYKIYKEPYQ